MTQIRSIAFAFLTAILVVATSCDSENSDAETEFFNLNVGSKWVYNRYDAHLEPPGVFGDFTLFGTDSVEVVETVTLNGLEFAKIRHKLTHATGTSITYSYQRVNAEGHLVGFSHEQALPEESEIIENNLAVFHPGEDLDYEHTISMPWGAIFYHAEGQTDLSVEGNNYNVWRYTADGIPTDPSLPTVTVSTDYEAQTGLVRVENATVTPFWRSEERLVSYDLN